MNGLLNVYKKSGETPFQVVEKVRESLSLNASEVKIGYAGRLDPLASGVLLLMLGETCKSRDEYQNSSKTYSFKVLLGVTTDTLDPMGIITQIVDVPLLDIDQVKKVCSEFTGTIQQRYPLYSSYAINGTPMYQLARQKQITDSDRPGKSVVIEKLVVKGIGTVDTNAFISEYVSTIEAVYGDFRQKEIIKQWNAFDSAEKLTQITVEVTVGSGTYMRVIAEDIALKLGTVGLAYDIVRTSVGSFKLEDSIRL